MKTCIGFGEYEGDCYEELTKEDNPNWCVRCDKLRCKYITRQLEKMVKGEA